MNNQEVWKDIIDYEGLYQVSSFGRVKSYDRFTRHNKGGLQKRHGRILVQSKNIWGYLLVTLCNPVSKKGKSVHRLVAEAFIPNINKKPQVNHLDGNKKNNSVDNLEWVDAFENMQHAVKTKLHVVKKGKENHMFGLTGEKSNVAVKVSQYDLKGNFTKTYVSIAEAAKTLNCCSTSISFCCIGKIKTSAGFQWRYYNGDVSNIQPVCINTNKRQIIQFDESGIEINKYNSITDAAKDIGTFSSSISKAIKLSTKHKKYFWKYA